MTLHLIVSGVLVCVGTYAGVLTYLFYLARRSQEIYDRLGLGQAANGVEAYIDIFAHDPPRRRIFARKSLGWLSEEMNELLAVGGGDRDPICRLLYGFHRLHRVPLCFLAIWFPQVLRPLIGANLAVARRVAVL